MECTENKETLEKFIIKCQGQGGRTKGFMSCHVAVKVVAGTIDQS